MYSCFDCGYLDKSRKNHSEKGNLDYFQYGCNKRGAGKFICGWCSSDNDLKKSALGCSDWVEKLKPCIYDKDRACNFKNLNDVKLDLGETCNRKCCWGCKEICGVKCNPSAHGVREKAEEIKPKIVFRSGEEQLPGQLSIFDL